MADEAFEPLTGSCMCGKVRYRVNAAFTTAGICHCRRCQHRSGVGHAVSGRVAAEDFEVTSGAGDVGTWAPQDGWPKSFCRNCGGQVFGGDTKPGGSVVVRFGSLDGEPGIEPSWHSWTSSAPSWDPVPDDGLTRYERGFKG